MVDHSFQERVMTRLGILGNITSRAMFGGVGLHWRDVIFGIVFQDRLYLKLYDQSRPEHERRGMGPFRPNGRQTGKGWSHSFKGRVTTGVVRDQPTLSSTTTDARPTESREGEVYGKAEEIIREASRADQSGQRATLYPGGLPAQRPHYREVRQGEPGDLPHHPDLWRPDP